MDKWDEHSGLSDLEKNTFQALTEAIARHTVAIVPRRGNLLGSGVCVSYKTEHFVATAAHVTKKRNLTDLTLVAKAPAPLQILRKSELAASIGARPQGVRFCPPFDDTLVSQDDSDVVLLHLKEVPNEMREAYFYDLAKGQVSNSL